MVMLMVVVDVVVVMMIQELRLVGRRLLFRVDERLRLLRQVAFVFDRRARVAAAVRCGHSARRCCVD